MSNTETQPLLSSTALSDGSDTYLAQAPNPSHEGAESPTTTRGGTGTNHNQPKTLHRCASSRKPPPSAQTDVAAGSYSERVKSSAPNHTLPTALNSTTFPQTTEPLWIMPPDSLRSTPVSEWSEEEREAFTLQDLCRLERRVDLAEDYLKSEPHAIQAAGNFLHTDAGVVYSDASLKAELKILTKFFGHPDNPVSRWRKHRKADTLNKLPGSEKEVGNGKVSIEQHRYKFLMYSQEEKTWIRDMVNGLYGDPLENEDPDADASGWSEELRTVQALYEEYSKVLDGVLKRLKSRRKPSVTLLSSESRSLVSLV